MDKIFIIVAGLGMGCIWMFLIEPWLDQRPRNGGFVKPRVYPKKSNHTESTNCSIKNPL